MHHISALPLHCPPERRGEVLCRLPRLCRPGQTTGFEAYFRWTELCFLASDLPTPVPEALANAPPS